MTRYFRLKESSETVIVTVKGARTIFYKRREINIWPQSEISLFIYRFVVHIYIYVYVTFYLIFIRVMYNVQHTNTHSITLKFSLNSFIGKNICRFENEISSWQCCSIMSSIWSFVIRNTRNFNLISSIKKIFRAKSHS